MHPFTSPARWSIWPWSLLLLGATLLFWKLQIFDAGTSTEITLGSYDIYTEHYPMTRYGFEALASGRLPLWNPYQLGGAPFLATPHVGLLYPGNWIYLVLDTAVATEVSFVLHLFWAGLGAFLLARTLGLPPLAGATWAVTFGWSGWMVFYANQASLVSGMSWLPMTVYLVERTARGSYGAGLSLAGAVALQLLNGATEFFVHSMLVAAAWSALRLGQLAAEGAFRTAAARGAGLLGAVAAGVLLAAPQLLPSMELASQSVRAQMGLTLNQAIGLAGDVVAIEYFDQALRVFGMVAVGVLPFAGVGFGLGTHWRALAVLLLSIALLAVLLASGGDVYALYFETPIGRLFRRPHKFLHVHAFAQAGLASLAVGWLAVHVTAGRRRIFRSPYFAAGVGVLVGGALWLALQGILAPGLLAVIVALVAFALLPAGPLRRGAVVAAVVANAIALFAGAEQQFVRPAARPEVFDAHDRTVDRLKVVVGSDRVHIAPDVYLLPGLMQKAGTLHGVRVAGDYSPLATMRAAEYFERAAPPYDPQHPFVGAIRLDSGSRFDLMDVAAVRLYVVRGGSPLDVALAEAAERPVETGVRRIADGFPRIYERRRALPRARFVPEARFAGDREAVLEALTSGRFDPTEEVLIEGDRPTPTPASRAPGDVRGRSRSAQRVSIVVDRPELVVVEVESAEPGYLVLADAWYPGWEATVDGEPAPLWPAYHLFRAVPVDAGASVVTFRYRPRAFHTGLGVAGVAALSLGTAWVLLRRRARRSGPGPIG